MQARLFFGGGKIPPAQACLSILRIFPTCTTKMCRKNYFLYFVIDFLTGNNRDFILFCHTMAEKLTNVKKQVEKIFFHLFLGKTSGKKFFPLVFWQNKWKNIFSTCFLAKKYFSTFFQLGLRLARSIFPPYYG